MKKKLSHVLSRTILVRLVIGSWTENSLKSALFEKICVLRGNAKVPLLDIGSYKEDSQSHNLTILNFEQPNSV